MKKYRFVALKKCNMGDNRFFLGIIYGDCGMYLDVLETEGNYYLRSWYNADGIIVSTTPNTNGKTYNYHFLDLTGRPVSTPSKGIYIRNGRKVLVK